VTVRARWVILVAASLLLSSCQAHFVGGWMPWWQGSTEKDTIAANAALINEISPFWYKAAPDGTIQLLGNGTTLDTTVAAVKSQGLVLPTIVDGNGPGIMRGILGDPVQRANHEQKIVDLVVSKGYDGIDLDYETFAFGDGRVNWPAITPVWVAFVNELATQLHANGKLLSVTVPPVWGGGASGYTVYAQDQIAASVDRLRLMVYDWSVGGAGPIAPLWWVDEVIAYSSSVVPAAKLQLGVPAHGRHWAVQKNRSEVCPDSAVYRDSITMKEAPGLAAAHGVTPKPAPYNWGEMTFTWEQVATGPRTKPVAPPVYTPPTSPTGVIGGTADPDYQPAVRLTPPSTFVSCTITHVVYYPDGNSVRQRAERAIAAGWHGIFIWALGYESADVWQQLANIP
jgi:spore germination protein YaaH